MQPKVCMVISELFIDDFINISIMSFSRKKIVTPLLRISMENSAGGRLKVVGIPGG